MSWSGKCLCGMYLGRAKTEYKRPIFFECFLYRNPSVCYEWFSDFVQTIDNLRAVKPHADILLLPYCNIDLLKPHSFRDSTITLLCLTLLIESSTRITPTSATLTDHIIQTTQMHSQIQTTQMHSQRSLYLTWASVIIAPSPVQNLFNFQNVNSKPILLYHLDRSSTLIAVCKFLCGWRSYGLKPFYFVHCMCLYSFLQLFVRHIVP